MGRINTEGTTVLTRRGAAVTALIIAAGFGANAPAFATTPAGTLYVNNAQGANCSDSGTGTGTKAQPYCTIQTAVNAVSAGQTVLIEPGIYKESVTITHSGTPTAPITIKGDSLMAPVIVQGATDAITVSGASDIVISTLETNGPGDGILIGNAHDVTFSQNQLNFTAGTYETPQIHVTGGSTGVDLVKNTIEATKNSAIVIDGGGSGDVVSTNLVDLSEGAGISVDSVTGVDIVSNTVDGTCDSGIALTGTSTGATLKNNIIVRTHPTGTSLTCAAPATPPRGIIVSAGSVSGTVENYNDVATGSATVPDYQWSGTDYATAAALNAATGQAVTDANTQAMDDGIIQEAPAEKSAAIDSADSSAPGEQSTDVYGRARVDDPLVTNSGTGTSAFFDRGAVERQDQIAFGFPQIQSPAGNSTTQAPVGATLTYVSQATSGWGGSVNYTYDFGDGTSSVTTSTGTTTHSYATAGTYQPSVTMTSSYGGQAGYGFPTLTILTGAPAPVLKVTSTGDMSVSVDVSATTDPWQLYDAQVDFGDSYNPVLNDLSKPISHTYTSPGTYTITLTLGDADNSGAHTSATYTTNGSDFTAYGPTRVLDTRKGIGTGGVVAPVGAGKSVQVAIGGTGTIPANATAVALNVTETGPTSNGYVTAYPTGGTFPTTSNLNYVAGQTKAANVVVGLGTGGAVTLTNTSSGSVHLVADVTGYFTKSDAAGYVPILPTRILDTRKGVGLPGNVAAKVGPGKTIAVNVGNSISTAVVLNLTATNTAGGGYITAYPDGSPAPLASSLNYAPGSTIANTVIVPVGADGEVDLYNGSSGTVDLVADEEGFFTQGSGDAFVPITPTRLFDSRKTTGPVAAGGSITLLPSDIDAQVPGSAGAYIYNVTVTQPAAGGYMTVVPIGQPLPTASNINFTAGETTSNTAIATAGRYTGVGADGFYNGSGGSLQLVTDLFGYFPTK